MQQYELLQNQNQNQDQEEYMKIEAKQFDIKTRVNSKNYKHSRSEKLRN